MCHAIVITGLPFAPYLDAKVKLKQECFNGIQTSQLIKARSVDGGLGGKATGWTHQGPITLLGAKCIHNKPIGPSTKQLVK